VTQRTSAQAHSKINTQRQRCGVCPALSHRVCRGIAIPDYYNTLPLSEIEVVVIAESPGAEEDQAGIPLIGTSGQEARHHILINGIASNRGVWLDNIIRCHPPDNRDPTPSEIDNCTNANLIPTLLQIQPKWIITMGRISTRWLLGDVDMEMVHGIPRTINWYGMNVVVIPTYHPALGLHDPSQMILFHGDMKVAGDVIRGKIAPHPPIDMYEGDECYYEIRDGDEFPVSPGEYDLVAVDTEWARNKPWCLSFSVNPGEAFVIEAGQTHALTLLSSVLSYGDTTTAIHNALYDLPVLDQMGIHPGRAADTMVMAYLLQSEPQGLKPLAFRYCGMEMKTYGEMVEYATYRMAIDYLVEVEKRKWPTPTAVLEWSKGEPKVRQPQNISRKIKKLFKSDNPHSGWYAISEGREVVEEVLGPMLKGELCDIDRPKAIRYSARDADATLRVFPLLFERIKALGLEETFWRDMGAMPMVVDMMANGMPISNKEFAKLSGYFQSRMDLIQRKIQINVGHHLGDVSVNPGSYPQMSTLIYDKLKLHEKGGRFKAKKGTNKSTAHDILMRYVHLDPVVQDIMDWREYQKLKTSFADAIPKLSVDGRIHTTLRMTRTVTGRLSSSNPNLMAQPVRSEEGRLIRNCYVAEEGWEFLSFDYKQVEMKVAANDSEDEMMLEIFWSGEDIHSQTASRMFELPVDELDEMKHRYPAKRVGFGILNLITAEGLQRELVVGGAGDFSVKECDRMILSWFEIYRGVAAYMKRNGEHAKRYGYVKDMWGRIRYIPGIKSMNRWTRLEAERQAGNAPIQMGAQGIIKEAMGRLVPIYKKMGDGVKPLIQIHDDLVWLARVDRVDDLVYEVRKTMEGAAPPGFMIPLDVDVKRGRVWGSMEKVMK